MKVLIIPEDCRKDQYVLKPLVEKMLLAVGRPRARVEVCFNPRLRGVAQAMDWEILRGILDRNRMVDLFLLCVDRDGHHGRKTGLERLERLAAESLPAGRLLAENAWQEVEVWLLAGHELPSDWSWRDVREEPNAKERYYAAFARARGVFDHPDEGRKALMREAAARYDRIRQLCPEDIQALEDRIRVFLGESL